MGEYFRPGKGRMRMNKQLKEKVMEALTSILPITAIVLLLSVTVAPLGNSVMMLFLFGALMLIAGMGLFTLGAEMAMLPMGEGIGVQLSKNKRILLPVLVCFILGVVITIAEPDLQVLATQIPSVPNMVLILSVAVGVGGFLGRRRAPDDLPRPPVRFTDRVLRVGIPSGVFRTGRFHSRRL